MNRQDLRNILIKQTVSVIANDGLDHTTTKAIVAGTDINEGYIYRVFRGKEDLLAAAFDSLDCAFMEQMMASLPLMLRPGVPEQECARAFFNAVWQSLLDNRESSLAFVRYFYSPYFSRNSVEAHRARFAPLLDALSPFFCDDADVWLILNHILNVMLFFVVKVHIGEHAASERYTEHVFRVIYQSVRQYLKNYREKEELTRHE